MKVRYLIVMFIIQAIYAYFAWPNNFVHEPTWFSIVAFIVGSAPMMFVVLRYHNKKAFIWGGVGGMALILPPLFFLTQMEHFPIISWLIYALIAVLVFVLTGLGVMLASWINQYFRWAFLLFAPALFVSFELVNTTLAEYIWLAPPPTIMTGYPMAGFPPLIQMASFTGVYGPGFLAVFLSAIVAFVGFEKCLSWERGREFLGVRPKVQPIESADRIKLMVTGGIISGLLVLLILMGNIEAAKYAKLQADSESTLKPALLQSNYDVSSEPDWNRRTEHRASKIIREMSKEAAAKGAEVLVFTENAVPGYLPQSKRLWDDLRDIFKEVNLPAIIGVVSESTPDRNFNIWYYLNRDGKVQNYYVKRYLIPFGEYLPMRPVINAVKFIYNAIAHRDVDPKVLTAMQVNYYDLTPGKQEKIFNIMGNSVFVKICDEIFISKYFRQGVRMGGEMIFSPSTSNWFPLPVNFYQHVLVTRFRAIEVRRWIGRVSSMAGSVVIDSLGIVRDQTPYNERAVHVYEIPALEGETFYVKYGDVFGWLCFLIMALFVGVATAKHYQALRK